jgi:hypothetical protein
MFANQLSPQKSLQNPTLLIFKKLSRLIWKKFLEAFMDLAPIVGVVVFFQLAVLRQPFPNLSEILIGLVFVVLGLMLFVKGLEMGLFPIGENIAYQLTRRGSVFWLMAFSFLLGFSTTIAEPALIAVADKAAEIAHNGAYIAPEFSKSYALGLRISVAVSVGLSIVIGVIRIIKGWSLMYLIISGYLGVIVMTFISPDAIIGIAYDAGGVTTSTITVPLVTALGVGLASSIKGRNPLTDGFGLIAFASLMPMIFVMGYGLFIFG